MAIFFMAGLSQLGVQRLRKKQLTLVPEHVSIGSALLGLRFGSYSQLSRVETLCHGKQVYAHSSFDRSPSTKGCQLPLAMSLSSRVTLTGVTRHSLVYLYWS